MLFHWFILAIWFIKKSYNLIGWEHFGPYLINKNFPKYRICAGTWQIRNPAFGPFCVHFPNFLVQKKFFKKSGSVIHNFKGVSNTMPKLIKDHHPIPRKCLERWAVRQKGRQTLFYSTLSAIANGQIIKKKFRKDWCCKNKSAHCRVPHVSYFDFILSWQMHGK